MYTRAEAKKATKQYYIDRNFTESLDLMTDVVVDKYLLKDKEGNYVESTPDDMHRRLAREFFRIESKFDNGKQRRFFSSEDDIFNYLKDFKYIVPQGSPMYGIGNDYVNVSLSNCVVIASPEDSMSGIMDSCKELANLMKRRCGVGIDISTLRPEHAPVNNSALTTTGAWSFADMFSYVCRSVGQNGRRGALMITMHCAHPDIMKFISMKNDKTKVTGANVSVLCTDEFMEAVVNDGYFQLQWPIESDNPSIKKIVKAREVWDMIGDYATFSAEPGVLLWSNILKELPANYYKLFKTICTNPCGEIPLSAYDSCRLISVNLANFVVNKFKGDAYIDFGKFEEVIHAAMRLSDDLVELEIEKIHNIISICDKRDEKQLWMKLLDAAEQGRRTGLGTHGLADLLAQMSVGYDTDEGLSLVEQIYRKFRDCAYAQSINLAKERGAFKAFDYEVEKDCPFIQRLPFHLKEELKLYGRRNISLLTNAPTGSTALVSGNTSSGCEPVWKNVYFRRVKMSDHNIMNVVPDFVDEMGDKWKSYPVYHPNLVSYLDLTGQDKNSKDVVIPDFFTESDNINWTNRVRLQGVMQQYIDHSISSTINLPRGTQPDVVKNLYIEAWKHGLKGVTVYVDGCRDGVLVTENDNKVEEVKPNSLLELLFKNECITEEVYDNVKTNIEKGLPATIPSLVKQVPNYSNSDMTIKKADGKKFYLHTSHLPEDKDKRFPVALWCMSNNVYDSDEPTYLNKVRRKFVNFMIEEGVSKELVEAKVEKLKTMTDYTGRLAKLISMALRHNIPLEKIVDALDDIDTDHFFSSLSAIRKYLASNIQDGTFAPSSVCPSCSSKNLVYTEGCKSCKDCGFSACN